MDEDLCYISGYFLDIPLGGVADRAKCSFSMSNHLSSSYILHFLLTLSCRVSVLKVFDFTKNII